MLRRLLTTAFIGLLVIAACPQPSHGADSDPAKLIPRKALFTPSSYGAVQLSPDGGRVAYVKIDGRSRALSIADIDHLEDSQSISDDVAGVPLNCWWTVDGKRLLVLYAVQGGRHLFCHDLETDRVRNLTPIPGVTVRVERMSHRLPDQVLVGLNDRDQNQHDLTRIDLATGERTLVIESTGFSKIHCDAQFRPRVAERRRGAGVDVLRRIESEQWLPVLQLSIDESNVSGIRGNGVKGVVGVDAAGEKVFVVDNTDRDKSALLSIDLVSGAKEVLVEDPDADVRARCVVDRYTGDVLAATSHFGELRRWPTQDSLASDFDAISRELGGAAGVVGVSATDRAWLVVPFNGGPTEFQVFDRQTGQLSRLFSTHPQLDDVVRARRRPEIVEARDGLRLPCQLYLPPGSDADSDGRPDQPLPTLMYVHGGPHIPNPWDSWFTNRNLQLLANRGYAVLNADYRGAGGYGKRFMESGFQQWGGEIQRDFVDIARWLVDESIAAPGQVGIWGWSFGGLSTFSALAFTPDEFACGIAMYGLSDMERFAASGLARDPSGMIRRVGDASTEQGRRRLRSQSPIHSATQVARPLLVTHGGRDRVAPRSHSDEMVAAIRDEGKSVTYIVYPSEPHDYRDDRSWMSFWAVGEQFLHEHLGGRFEPFGRDLEFDGMQVADGAEFITGLQQQLEDAKT